MSQLSRLLVLLSVASFFAVACQKTPSATRASKSADGTCDSEFMKSLATMKSTKAEIEKASNQSSKETLVETQKKQCDSFVKTFGKGTYDFKECTISADSKTKITVADVKNLCGDEIAQQQRTDTQKAQAEAERLYSTTSQFCEASVVSELEKLAAANKEVVNLQKISNKEDQAKKAKEVYTAALSACKELYTIFPDQACKVEKSKSTLGGRVFTMNGQVKELCEKYQANAKKELKIETPTLQRGNESTFKVGATDATVKPESAKPDEELIENKQTADLIKNAVSDTKAIKILSVAGLKKLIKEKDAMNLVAAYDLKGESKYSDLVDKKFAGLMCATAAVDDSLKENDKTSLDMVRVLTNKQKTVTKIEITLGFDGLMTGIDCVKNSDKEVTIEELEKTLQGLVDLGLKKKVSDDPKKIDEEKKEAESKKVSPAEKTSKVEAKKDETNNSSDKDRVVVTGKKNSTSANSNKSGSNDRSVSVTTDAAALYSDAKIAISSDLKKVLATIDETFASGGYGKSDKPVWFVEGVSTSQAIGPALKKVWDENKMACEVVSGESDKNLAQAKESALSSNQELQVSRFYQTKSKVDKMMALSVGFSLKDKAAQTALYLNCYHRQDRQVDLNDVLNIFGRLISDKSESVKKKVETKAGASQNSSNEAFKNLSFTVTDALKSKITNKLSGTSVFVQGQARLLNQKEADSAEASGKAICRIVGSQNLISILNTKLVLREALVSDERTARGAQVIDFIFEKEKDDLAILSLQCSQKTDRPLDISILRKVFSNEELIINQKK